MTYRLSDAVRRADLSLAGALFLSLATAATWAVSAPSNSPSVLGSPKFRPAVFDASGSQQQLAELRLDPLPEPAAPGVVPAPRPAPTFLSRLKINVAFQNLAAETACLAEALYYEARGQGVLGQQAIAEVVVRRTHRAGFPHSICGVVHQGSGSACQFSFVCDGTMDKPKATGEWNRAVRLATRIITGAMPLTNITQGAISFHAASLDTDWPGMERTVTVGHNAFYRRPERHPI